LACIVPARPSLAETTIGLQALYFNGTHFEIDGSQHFAVPAALLQVRQRWKAIDLYVEGIPSTGGHSYLAAPTGFAQPVTSLSVFDAVSHVRLDRPGRLWAGAGLAIVNQITSIGSPPTSAASRVVGGRYELEADLPLGPRGTVEMRAAFMPAMHGTVYAQSPFIYPFRISASEKAESTDLTGEYVLRSHRMRYGLGVRAINYVAHFVTPDELADRNSGLGIILEARYALF
jgi:hypothetical protein